VLARVIQGLTAGDMPALFAYLADITPPEKRAQRFGLLGALSGIGMMIGPAVGGLLAAVSLQLPVFLTAAVGLTIAILSIFLLPESVQPHNRAKAITLRQVQPFAVFKDAFGRKELRAMAERYEHDRDLRLARYHQYEFASAAFQIGIVLASAAVITGIVMLAYLAAAVGVGGLGFMALGVLAPHVLDLLLHAGGH
jgi:MFS family permease